MRELCRSCWAYAATAILGIVAAFSILPSLVRPERAGTAPSRDRDGVLEASEAFALYHLGEQDRVRDLVSKNQPTHGDRVEWRLLAQLVHHPDPVVLTTDYGIVQELVPIPHSDQFASATEGGVIEIWDLTTRQRVKMLEPVAEPLYSLAVSTDGKTIAAAGENLHLWDRESGQRLRRIKSYPHNVESLLFVNGDQELIVGLRYEFLELLRVGDGKTLRSVPFNNRFRMIVPVPAQDQLLVPAADEPAGGIGQSEKYIQLRTRDLSKELREFRHGDIEHMAISHDGRLLATSSRFIDDIVIFDFNSAEKLDVAKVTSGSHCRSLAFSLDDQYLISGHTDGTVKCWPLAASKSIDGKSAPRVFDESRVNTFQAGHRWVDSIFVTSRGDLVTNALDNQIKIWKLGGRPFASDSQKCDWLGVGSEILKAGLCDRFVSVMFDDGSVFVSHANSFSECDAILPAGNVRHSAGLSPDGNTLAVQRSGQPAYLIDISDPKNRKPVIGDSLQDSSDLWNSPFVWNVDGTKIAGRCADNLIKLWDVAERRLLQSWQFEYDITDGVIFSPDGSTLAIGAINAPQLILLDLATGGTTQIRGGGDAGVLVWSPDGRYIANRTYGGKVYLVPVDAAAESDIRILGSVPSGPIAFGPDGSTLLLSASPGEIGLVDVETGRSLGYFHRSSDADVVYLGFSADGESILAVLGPRPSAPTRPGELLSWRLSLPSP
jgi:WD40 repeat protein